VDRAALLEPRLRHGGAATRHRPRSRSRSEGPTGGDVPAEPRLGASPGQVRLPRPRIGPAQLPGTRRPRPGPRPHPAFRDARRQPESRPRSRKSFTTKTQRHQGESVRGNREPQTSSVPFEMLVGRSPVNGQIPCFLVPWCFCGVHIFSDDGGVTLHVRKRASSPPAARPQRCQRQDAQQSQSPAGRIGGGRSEPLSDRSHKK